MLWMKSEEELIEDILEGDYDSFEVLLRPYRQMILNIGYRMTGSHEEAREISQEALIKIFKHLRSFKQGQSLKNWIYATVINCSYDHLRKKIKEAQIVENQQRTWAANDRINPEKQFLNQEITKKIYYCLQVLSPREKAVFILRDAEGFSIKEAAKILRCSPLSIRTHLSRARRKIRNQFLKIYPMEEWEVKG